MNSCTYPRHTDKQSGELAGLGCLSVVLGFFGFVLTCFALLGMIYSLAVHDCIAAEVVVIIGAIMAVGCSSSCGQRSGEPSREDPQDDRVT